MSRVTVIHEDRKFRCSARVAAAYIANGATLDTTDERGAAAYMRHMKNRPAPEPPTPEPTPEPKPKAKPKTKSKPKSEE